MKTSVTGRTFIVFTIFSVIILFLLWFFQVQFFAIFYQRYQMNIIRESAIEIKNTIEEDLDNKLESLAYEKNICIQYYYPFGKINNYNTKNKMCLLSNPTLNIMGKYQKELIKDENHFIILEGSNGEKSVVYAVNLGGGKFILLNTQLEDMSTATYLLKHQMIYISIVIIILAVVLALIVSKQINKPIVNITNKAKEMGKGNYDIQFEESNITELEELSNVLSIAASEMKQTDELRRDLLANISHDLKTPLTMIKAYAEKVRDISYKDDEKRNKDLSVIIDESDRLNILVNDLVEMSKIESKESKLDKTKYDLKDEINEVMKRYALLQEKEGYTLKVELPESDLVVYADRNKLDQVFYNLINNAIEHSGDDKVVDIKVRLKKDEITVNIINYGKSIKKEEIPLVWNRYYTKEKNHKRNTIGTGIGLSIVKDVFTKHNIKYGIETKGSNYTNFYFILKNCKK